MPRPRLLVSHALLAALLMVASGCDTTSDLTDTAPNVAGIRGTVSPDGFSDVNARLDAALAEAGPVTVAATVGHAMNAASAGLSLPPTRVVLFGNPMLGTPLMQADPRVGLDLPQQILTYAGDGPGTVVAYNTPAYLQQRYGLGALPQLDLIAQALAGFTAAAAGSEPTVTPFSSPLTTAEGDGLVRVVSTSDAASTRSRLRGAIEGNDALTLVLELDHQANAASVGLELGPTAVFVFGNPELGTPLMNARRTTGIDLPQKMLVYTDADGETAVLYNDPAYLARRHGITDQSDTIEAISGALAGLAATAAGL